MFIGNLYNKKYDSIDALMKAYLNLNLLSISSYANNDFLLKQGSAENTIEYKYHYQLHRAMEIENVDDGGKLIRLGREYDGGYILYRDSKGIISRNKIAYSLGISDDVSFDLDIAEMGYDIYQYDHTISNLPEENEHFHWKKIGITGSNESKILKSIETLIHDNGHENSEGMLLKADIEGAEWDMINNCSEKTLSKFDQIVIELHNLCSYENRDSILEALTKLSNTHRVVHIHANNNSYVNFSGNMITPNVLEATFLLKENYSFSKSNKTLPIDLDQPCRKEFNEILLGFWNV